MAEYTKTEDLLAISPYDGTSEANDLFNQALIEELRFHYDNNEMYRHFWDSEDPRYETLHWKYAEADSLIIFRDSIKSMPWGKNRVEAGCELLGGCWCLIKEKFCSGEECRVP